MKLLFVLDIGSGSLKLIAGYLLDNRPLIVDVQTSRFPLLLSEGKVANHEKVAKAIKKLVEKTEEILDVKIDNLIVNNPPVDYLVFQSRNTTNVVNQQGYITALDISNLANLFRRIVYDDSHALLTIVPNLYETKDQQMSETPLNVVSDSITLDAYLHFNKLSVVNDYREICAALDIPIRRYIGDNLASATANTLLKVEGNEEYFLIDFGASLTNVSFISNHNIYSSSTFFTGSDHLTNVIAAKYGISFDAAQNLKEKFGYEKRENYYDGVVHSYKTNEQTVTVSQSDLNETIQTFFLDYFEELDRHVTALSEKLTEVTNPRKIPFILTGGGSKLKGLSFLYKTRFPTHASLRARYEVLGARSSEFSVALGLIMAGSMHEELNDTKKQTITPFGRVKQSSKKGFNPAKDEI